MQVRYSYSNYTNCFILNWLFRLVLPLNSVDIFPDLLKYFSFALLLVPGIRPGLKGNTVQIRNCPATVSAETIFYSGHFYVVRHNGKAENRARVRRPAFSNMICDPRGMGLTMKRFFNWIYFLELFDASCFTKQRLIRAYPYMLIAILCFIEK